MTEPHVEESTPTGVSRAPVVVRPSSAGEDAARDALVEAHPEGTPFHLAGWRRAAQRAFGHEPFDLLAWRDDRLVGLLPLMRVPTPFGAKHLLSVPYAVYGGPLAEDEETVTALVRAGTELAERERVGRFELRTPAPLPAAASEGFHAHDLYATFVRDVPDEPEEVLKRMPKRARAEVRKARDKHSLELSEGAWYIDDLVRLFHASKRSLGSPGLPAAWFAALLAELGPERARIHVARSAGELVAATMSFVLRGTFYLYYIGTTDDGNRVYKATNYLVARLQELCAEEGLPRFDLGRSRVESGPYQFKKNQGFEPQPLAYRIRLVRSASLPSFNPSNPRTKGLRDTWSRLPSWLTRRLSDQLARYLP